MPKANTAKETTEGQDLIEKLRKERPEMAISVSRTRDDSYVWDGDGPDPVENGFDPYDVDVEATVILGGKKINGVASLGGSYFAEGEPIGEMHGYLKQKVEEAVQDLDRQLAKLPVQIDFSILRTLFVCRNIPIGDVLAGGKGVQNHEQASAQALHEYMVSTGRGDYSPHMKIGQVLAWFFTN